MLSAWQVNAARDTASGRPGPAAGSGGRASGGGRWRGAEHPAGCCSASSPTMKALSTTATPAAGT